MRSAAAALPAHDMTIRAAQGAKPRRADKPALIIAAQPLPRFPVCMTLPPHAPDGAARGILLPGQPGCCVAHLARPTHLTTQLASDVAQSQSPLPCGQPGHQIALPFFKAEWNLRAR
jgi:hypothetical protein